MILAIVLLAIGHGLLAVVLVNLHRNERQARSWTRLDTAINDHNRLTIPPKKRGRR